jgi:hypothetical protein
MIIQQLFNNRASLTNSTGIAYFYFDFADLAKQSVDNALRRLVLQLSRQSPTSYETLRQQFDLCKGLTVPTYAELLVILQKLLGMFGRTYLILDALDESNEQDRVADFIETISAWSGIQLHVLVTSQSRRIFDLKFSSLENLSRIAIHAEMTADDIRLYLCNELASRDELQLWKPKWAQIVDSILHKSAGM